MSSVQIDVSSVDSSSESSNLGTYEQKEIQFMNIKDMLSYGQSTKIFFKLKSSHGFFTNEDFLVLVVQ